MSQILWDVLDKYGRLLFTGTLAECYEAYPTLACVEIGQKTSRGLSMLVHGDEISYEQHLRGFNRYGSPAL